MRNTVETYHNGDTPFTYENFPNGHEQSTLRSDPWESIQKRNPQFIHPETLPKEDPKSSALLLIGNAHLDKAWLWEIWHGTSRVHHTFRSVLNLMEKPGNESFTFTASSSDHYFQVEKQDKGMFREIQERIKEGRWDVVGGGWVEPDLNKPSAESLASSFRIGQQYAAEALGVTPTVALEADGFGHPDSLIQILTQSGYEFYMHMRPQVNEKDLPLGPYRWQLANLPYAIDAQRIFEEYTSGPISTESHIRRAAEAIKGRVRVLPLFWGIGNHGGGPTQPVIDAIQRLQEDESLPQLLYATPHEYYAVAKAMGKTFPTVSGPLQWHAPGCYIVNQENERVSQEAEATRDTARAISAIVHFVNGASYPHTRFREADRVQAEQDFHDIRAGSSIEPVYETAKEALLGTIFSDKTAISDALQSLSHELNLPEALDSNYFFVMNPHAFPTHSYIEIEHNDFQGNLQILDAQNNVLPYQTVSADAKTGSVANRRIKVGLQLDVPSLGYTVIQVKNNQEVPEWEHVPSTETSLENEFLNVEFDPDSGHLLHFIDKTTGYDLVYSDAYGITHPMGVPVICDDAVFGRPVDTWGHKKTKWEPNVIEAAQYDKKSGGYVLPTFESFKLRSLRLEESGPVFSRLRGVWTYKDTKRASDPHNFDGDSILTQDFILRSGSPQLEVNGHLRWFEQHKMLKLMYPLGLESRKTSSQAQYGSASYGENGDEHPMHRWLNMTGRRRDQHKTEGLAIFNSGLSSYSVDERTIGLTIVRSPDFATHDPLTNDPMDDHKHTDQADHSFRFALMPHQADAEDVLLDQKAAEFIRPPQYIQETMRKGFRPREDSFLQVSEPNVFTGAIKGADNNDGIVFRFLETAGKQTTSEVAISTLDKPFTLSLKPHELKTVRVRRNGGVEVIDIPEQTVFENIRKDRHEDDNEENEIIIITATDSQPL